MLSDLVIELVEQNRSNGLHTNRSHFGGGVELLASVRAVVADLLFDPQTSGGLLVAVGAGLATEALDRLMAAAVPAVRIGRVTTRGPRLLAVA